MTAPTNERRHPPGLRGGREGQGPRPARAPRAILTDEQPRLTRDAIWQAVTESVSTPDFRLNATPR
jgi:hypothetical protein